VFDFIPRRIAYADCKLGVGIDRLGVFTLNEDERTLRFLQAYSSIVADTILSIYQTAEMSVLKHVSRNAVR